MQSSLMTSVTLLFPLILGTSSNPQNSTSGWQVHCKVPYVMEGAGDRSERRLPPKSSLANKTLSQLCNAGSPAFEANSAAWCPAVGPQCQDHPQEQQVPRGQGRARHRHICKPGSSQHLQSWGGQMLKVLRLWVQPMWLVCRQWACRLKARHRLSFQSREYACVSVSCGAAS